MFVVRRLPPKTTRSVTLLPSTTLFRSQGHREAHLPVLLGHHQRSQRDDARPLPVAAVRVHRRERLCADGVSDRGGERVGEPAPRSAEHTSELQSLMCNSYAVFCSQQKKRCAFTVATPTEWRLYNI